MQLVLNGSVDRWFFGFWAAKFPWSLAREVPTDILLKSNVDELAYADINHLSLWLFINALKVAALCNEAPGEFMYFVFKGDHSVSYD